MEIPAALARLLQDTALAADVARGARTQAARLGADLHPGALRLVIRAAGLEGSCDGVALESLWLLSHRALRRAGFRSHAGAPVVLLGWRGEGLVLVRPGGERRSVPLVPWDAPPEAAGRRHLVIDPGVPYDTLADAETWHVLAFHAQPASLVTRLQETPAGWAAISEEEPS